MAKFSKIFIFNQIFKNVQFWQVNEFQDSLPEVLKRENLTMKLVETHFIKIMIFKRTNFWSGGLLNTFTVTLFLQNPSVFFTYIFFKKWSVPNLALAKEQRSNILFKFPIFRLISGIVPKHHSRTIFFFSWTAVWKMWRMMSREIVLIYLIGQGQEHTSLIW